MPVAAPLWFSFPFPSLHASSPRWACFRGSPGWPLGAGTYVGLQKVVHAGLRHLLGLLELLEGLAQLLVGDLALPLLLVVEVQATALQLLQVVLGARRGSHWQLAPGPPGDHPNAMHPFPLRACVVGRAGTQEGGTPKGVLGVYLDLLQVFVAQVLQGVDEVLLDLYVQGVLDLSQALHRLPRVQEGVAWGRGGVRGRTVIRGLGSPNS